MNTPTPEEQRRRLDAKFRQIAQSFRDFQLTVAGVDPEHVLILETITQAVDNVAKAAAKIPGLEWLAERDLQESLPEFGFADAVSPAKPLPVRLYALMSTQAGIQQLLRLWTAWHTHPDARAANNFGPFKQLFIHLRDIRQWSAQDRIAETGVIERWQEDLQVRGTQGSVRFEVELWFRRDPQRRAEAYNELSQLVTAAGGQCLDHAVIPEIRYHAVLAEISAAAAQQTLAQIEQQDYPPLLRCEGVMVVRPFGQSRFTLRRAEERDFDLTRRIDRGAQPAGEPVIALLDGLPVENHDALAGRLLIDDPDDHASRYAAEHQQHGTAMSSLIAHGDLNGNGPSLRRPIYVRPILLPHTVFEQEVTPGNRLLVDLVHGAIRRMIERNGENPPIAPDVVIVNFSIGDLDQPFAIEPSPLARLLDWLAWKYRLLFIVSVGNYAAPITIAASAARWRNLAHDELIAQTLHAMKQLQALRRPLSPAEAINALTVGAIHADECPTYELGPRVDLFHGLPLPSPINTVANGFRRSTKPDILLNGGRQLYNVPTNNDETSATFVPALSFAGPGQLVATPGIRPLELGRVKHSCGTSNAAAIASRSAALIHEALSALQLSPDTEPLTRDHWPVVIKALLVHAATWGHWGDHISQVLAAPDAGWRDIARLKQLFLGYGQVEVHRSLFSTDQRATVIGWSTLTVGTGHIYRLPLPPSLSASKEVRRLRATLAWLTPLNHEHKNYRRASLWIDVPEETLGVSRDGLDADAARRGTVEHRTFEGNDAKAFVDGAFMEIKVNCKEDAGTFSEPIPYAIAFTVEVGQNVQLNIYNEISNGLRTAVEVRNR